MKRDLTGANWRKASASSNNSQCVEVADLRDAVAVRDSKSPDGGALVVEPATWSAFLADVTRD